MVQNIRGALHCYNNSINSYNDNQNDDNDSCKTI